MVLFITVPKAQQALTEKLRARRLAMGLTQEGLARRAGVSLPTLRKFEQKGIISLESFLKLLVVLEALNNVVSAVDVDPVQFHSIEEVIKASEEKPTRKKGWRK